MFLSQLNIYLPCVVLVPPATREELHDGLHDGHASTYHICARSRLHDWLRRMALHTGKGQNRLFSIHSESNGTCAVDGPSLQSRRRSSLPPCALLRILCILCRLRVYLNSLEPTGNGDIRSATAWHGVVSVMGYEKLLSEIKPTYIFLGKQNHHSPACAEKRWLKVLELLGKSEVQP